MAITDTIGTDMTMYHYRNVRMFNGMMLSLWLARSGEPLGSDEQRRLLDDRLDLIDEILHGIPWRLGYRKINTDNEPVSSKHAPPIMWGFTSMWALVFACDALCHEATAMFFGFGISEMHALSERASAQLHWAIGRLRFIDKLCGIRQSSAFADNFSDRWAHIMMPKQQQEDWMLTPIHSFDSGVSFDPTILSPISSLAA